MLKSQIQSGTITETENVHMRLFEAARQVCSVPGEVTAEPEMEEEEATKGQDSFLSILFSSFLFLPLIHNVLSCPLVLS